jgi:GNAT superfamily N-acetyltransferase
MPTIEIRPLARGDDRASFSCGEPAIDRFFQHYAGQNQFKLRLAVTYVVVQRGPDEQIIGFATVAVGSIERREIPDSRLIKRLPAYPLPILRLARLGVDQHAQGHGVGHRLLRHVLKLALLQRDTSGCVGVVADAKPDALGFYERLGFVPLIGLREGRLHGEQIPMFLSVGEISAAMDNHEP